MLKNKIWLKNSETKYKQKVLRKTDTKKIIFFNIGSFARAFHGRNMAISTKLGEKYNMHLGMEAFFISHDLQNES